MQPDHLGCFSAALSPLVQTRLVLRARPRRAAIPMDARERYRLGLGIPPLNAEKAPSRVLEEVVAPRAQPVRLSAVRAGNGPEHPPTLLGFARRVA